MVSIETMKNIDAFIRIAPFLEDNIRKAVDQSSSHKKNDPRTIDFVGRYH